MPNLTHWLMHEQLSRQVIHGKKSRYIFKLPLYTNRQHHLFKCNSRIGISIPITVSKNTRINLLKSFFKNLLSILVFRAKKYIIPLKLLHLLTRFSSMWSEQTKLRHLNMHRTEHDFFKPKSILLDGDHTRMCAAHLDLYYDSSDHFIAWPAFNLFMMFINWHEKLNITAWVCSWLHYVRFLQF